MDKHSVLPLMSSNNIIPKNVSPLNSLSNPIKDTLDTWLKFGTVFLVYRLCSYFFFDQNKKDAQLFDKECIALVLFILIGFSLYYLLVKPYIPVKFQHPVIKNLTNDVLMFGTVLLSSHVFESLMSHGDMFSGDWMKNAGIIILAFAVYDIIMYPFIPCKGMTEPHLSLGCDWAKYGAFLIIYRILQGRPLADQQWILSVLFTLLGFTGYHFVTKKIINIF